MIWKTWTRKSPLHWNQRSQFATEDVRLLQEGPLVWRVDKLVKTIRIQNGPRLPSLQRRLWRLTISDIHDGIR